MANQAYIKLVPSSVKQTITIDELKETLEYYKEITGKTGEQLNWQYNEAAFPYEITEEIVNNTKQLILISNHERYHSITLSINEEKASNSDENEAIQTYIQLTLTNRSTYGDKGKANEFCKFLANKFQGELHLFNGRIMYYYKRK
ncbi:DUF1885 family protein [Niallia endozanthoxylica]|uniref:DUF1885 family protein n=1 Tax=Niallia endozanthoxylica TaxID=2036016 RepID=A0A5J5HUG8_9BACI|nr:DUF1885 family protein [Niallia endozanthoxylica]KAA9026025.1 DUF1885 family protein [Niallia endozanthoxylica]